MRTTLQPELTRLDRVGRTHTAHSGASLVYAYTLRHDPATCLFRRFSPAVSSVADDTPERTERKHTADARSAFTLMEVSLVLALIVIVAALAAPAFQSTLKNEQLRKAAESIRADWARTQSQAIMTGETQVWVCMLAAGSFSASAAGGATLEAMPSTSDVANNLSANTGLTPTQGPVADTTFGRTLPEGVSIQEVLVSEADSVTSMAQTSTAGEDGMATVFFYPDGTSSSARITVVNEDQRAIAVMLNGIAGTIRVSPVEEAGS